MERCLDVSEEVYQTLLNHITEFGDTPDSVLRRLLGLTLPDGIKVGEDGKLQLSIVAFPCVDRREDHETRGTGACVHCGFEDAVCVGQRRDPDGDWYDCDETAEWMGVLHKGRGPEPFCGSCIKNADRLYPGRI